MEIFGGFMVMMSIISLFLAVVWLIMPFVVFAIKGKQDRALEILEGIDKRLTVLEDVIKQQQIACTPSSREQEGTASLAVHKADTVIH